MRKISQTATVVVIVLFTMCGAGAAQVSGSPNLVRMALDLGGYRGYWRIENVDGSEVAHDECFTQRVCREAIKPLPEGDYVLVLTGQPQSVQFRYKLTTGALIVTSGSSLATAEGLTLRLNGLRRVVFDTNGYRGAWSLDLWKGAEATGFFKRDAGEQTIELFPDTTYALNIGPFTAERFQIGRDDKIVIIDGSGVVRVPAEARNRLLFQTIEVAFYPYPLPDAALWSIDGLAPPDGRAAFSGPAILRLVQGGKYRLLEATNGAEIPDAFLTTGKACNMVSKDIRLERTTLYATPIMASCSRQVDALDAADSAIPRRNKAP